MRASVLRFVRFLLLLAALAYGMWRFAARRAARNERHIVEILRATNEAIISIDPQQQIIVFSRGAERVFGYDADELMGQPLDLLLPAEKRFLHRHEVEQFGRGPETTRLMGQRRSEIMGRRKDGSLFPAEVTISKVTTIGPLLYTAVVLDISDRRRQELALRSAYEALVYAYDATLEGWVHALDLRDKETEGHTRRVTALTIRLGIALGVMDGDLEQWRRGALLHDIGKLGVPDRILLKDGPLTEDEWAIMKRHPVYADEWLSPIAYLKDARDIPAKHHEWWDGSGYPRGLIAEAIPLAARAFAVVDAFDALSNARPYKPALSTAAALAEIRSRKGSQFDPRIVEVFCLGVEAGSFGGHDGGNERAQQIGAGEVTDAG